VSDLLYRTGVITLTCETEVPGEKPDAVPLCPRQISQFTGFEPDPLAWQFDDSSWSMAQSAVLNMAGLFDRSFVS